MQSKSRSSSYLHVSLYFTWIKLSSENCITRSLVRISTPGICSESATRSLQPALVSLELKDTHHTLPPVKNERNASITVNRVDPHWDPAATILKRLGSLATSS